MGSHRGEVGVVPIGQLPASKTIWAGKVDPLSAGKGKLVTLYSAYTSLIVEKCCCTPGPGPGRVPQEGWSLHVCTSLSSPVPHRLARRSPGARPPKPQVCRGLGQSYGASLTSGWVVHVLPSATPNYTGSPSNTSTKVHGYKLPLHIPWDAFASNSPPPPYSRVYVVETVRGTLDTQSSTGGFDCHPVNCRVVM